MKQDKVQEHRLKIEFNRGFKAGKIYIINDIEDIANAHKIRFGSQETTTELLFNLVKKLKSQKQDKK